ncbi:hypothetical protein HGT71_02705 [Rosenbergiella epipactidis]|uniref:hypothetical protein n=1 Tax=Erwiniaceae TaxID=1903409 RepID=UPI0006645263|nr:MULTISPECIES: hypothetical protein [Erwiniaceae]KMV69080.1 hypothetical protein AI29_05980 [bacteria symbiont BFo2 of Frankliniella occidentalis]KYP88976.1 hypothetical protein WB60_09410 [bacteria symbiont BFo2 of Frankliniella occidentalis]KYP93725.1 hypothetical protein WB67_12605 [bacteria symbiont BFo2 of Frankliniella occidentalis]MBT0717198.1 hypothetical protein [Rosenbergiella epipactidis]MCL9667979.1 hypothetical protein [Rosenbergiella epipactidis]
MTKIAFLAPFFEVDIVDIQIVELYSYRLYNEQEEERLLALSTLIVNNALIKLYDPPLSP